MKVWIYTIVSIVFVSLISLAGLITLSLNKKRMKKILLFLVSFAVGALVTLVIGQQFGDAILFLLPLTAGGFLYIAGPDLIPELQHEVKLSVSIGQFVSIILGVGIMALLVLVD